jgi:hypothetical protein
MPVYAVSMVGQPMGAAEWWRLFGIIDAARLKATPRLPGWDITI